MKYRLKYNLSALKDPGRAERWHMWGRARARLIGRAAAAKTGLANERKPAWLIDQLDPVAVEGRVAGRRDAVQGLPRHGGARSAASLR
eukprot:3939848-Rhodomonas_salina.3